MDSRTAAHVLQQIAAYLELRGENRFKARAYYTASRGVLALGADDLAPLVRSGEIGRVRGVGPATLAVLRDLVETGTSRYLDELREVTPEGLLEMLGVPGLTPERIHLIHEELGVRDLDELEAAAHDGRLAKLRGLGPRTVEKILKGVTLFRDSTPLTLFPHARAEADRLAAMVRQHPDVRGVAVAGAVRRHREVVGEIDVVARCDATASPERVAESFTRISGVRDASGQGSREVHIHFVDGSRLALHCTTPAAFPVTLWRATGNGDHLELVADRLRERGYIADADVIRDRDGKPVALSTEEELYLLAGLAFIPPELREAEGEVEAAARRALPRLIEPGALRGVLHCHSHYSDGKSSVAQLAQAAQQRGWSYLGISDHSAAAFYAGGLSREKVLAQHEEIDELNAKLAGSGFRVLKGIEADILADGRLDYDEGVLSTFDYVIGSVHSRFAMDGAAMTERVLRALDDPHLTILAHPTGRLLLSRDPYALDVDAVIERAAEVGVAVELNCDPHRMDLDWRHLITAKRRGATVAIGPDAHSVNALDNVVVGIGMARKGWLEERDVLNARDADEVLGFARRRRVSDSSIAHPA